MAYTGKNNAQSIDEMLEGMNEAREKGLATTHGKSLYKRESGEYQKEQLQDLIALNINELAEVATRERVSLADTDEVKRRTIIYLRACEESGTFPSNLGLARSLGYSDRGLRRWRSQHPDSPTGLWLEQVSDMCADILHQSSLKGNAQPILAIFLSKAMYDLREVNELVVTPHSITDEETSYSADEIRKRYLIDTEGEDE